MATRAIHFLEVVESNATSEPIVAHSNASGFQIGAKLSGLHLASFLEADNFGRQVIQLGDLSSNTVGEVYIYNEPVPDPDVLEIHARNGNGSEYSSAATISFASVDTNEDYLLVVRVWDDPTSSASDVVAIFLHPTDTAGSLISDVKTGALNTAVPLVDAPALSLNSNPQASAVSGIGKVDYVFFADPAYPLSGSELSTVPDSGATWLWAAWEMDQTDFQIPNLVSGSTATLHLSGSSATQWREVAGEWIGSSQITVGAQGAAVPQALPYTTFAAALSADAPSRQWITRHPTFALTQATALFTPSLGSVLTTSWAAQILVPMATFNQGSASTDRWTPVDMGVSKTYVKVVVN